MLVYQLEVFSLFYVFSISLSSLKTTEPHAVRKEVIRQITVPENEDARPRRKLEVTGDFPPKVGQNYQIKNLTEATATTHNALQRSKTEMAITTHNAFQRGKTESAKTTHNAFQTASNTHNAFPRSRTNLSSAAKRGTKRYVRQFLVKSNSSSSPTLLEKDLFQSPNGFLPDFDKNLDDSRTLPYIKLQQSVTDYKTYKQNSSPFVRTLI